MSEESEETEAPPPIDRNYPYSDYIKSPRATGASAKGTTQALKKDLDILGYYVDVLISGNSRAQTLSGPLGNKYFLATNTDCKDVDGVAHPRYVFVNNIPMGTGPDGKGGPRGLIPGIVQDMMYVNPSKLFSVFSQRDLCRPVTMETRDIYNKVDMETQYVLDDDLIDYPGAWFPDNVNPINNSTGTGLLPGIIDPNAGEENFTTEPDLPETVYYISIGIIGFYLMTKLAQKSSIQRVFKKLNYAFK